MGIYFTTEDTEFTEDEEEKIKTSMPSVSSVVKFKSLFRQCRALPHFIVPNATLYRPKCHRFRVVRCGIPDDEVWHFGE